MTKSIIRKQREALEVELIKLEDSYLKARLKIWDKQKELSAQCKHENMNGGQYYRWCPDCGYNEDTT